MLIAPDLPLVSLVTPTLNQGDFITQTIKSVLAQDYPLLEYLVMDGGSTDQTLDILRSVEMPFHWISEPDSGQSSAINKGWRMASGEILGWLNSDDLLRPNAIHTVARVFQESPEIVMIYGDCDYISLDGQLIGKYATGSWSYSNYLTGVTNVLPQPSVFVRRTAAARAGWLDESLHYLMDYDLFLRIGLEGQVRQLPDTLSAMRLHTDAKSLRSLKGFGPEMIQVIAHIFNSDKLPENLLVYRAEAMRKAYLYAAATAYWGGDVQEARTRLAQCWREVSWPQVPASLIRLSLMTALGKPGRLCAERWPGNPFTRTLTNQKMARTAP